MLSIVIPAREEERAVCGTASFFKIALEIPHEVIVSDDGSSDGTVARAKECADKVVEFSGSLHTAARSRNAGARVAEGEFLVFVDADTFIPEPNEFFRRALAHFSDPRVVSVCGPQRAFPSMETWADWISFAILNNTIRFANNVLRWGEASGKFMLVRRAAFEKIGGFREELVTREDGDLFLRLSKIGRTVYDPGLMVFHHARRAHRIGWLKLWRVWIVNTVSMALFDRVVAEDWAPVR